MLGVEVDQNGSTGEEAGCFRGKIPCLPVYVVNRGDPNARCPPHSPQTAGRFTKLTARPLLMFCILLPTNPLQGFSLRVERLVDCVFAARRL